MTSPTTDFYAIEDLLAPEEIAIRDRVRAFCDEEVLPRINDYWERAEFPFELVPKIAELGMAGGTIQGHGCPGMNGAAGGRLCPIPIWFWFMSIASMSLRSPRYCAPARLRADG